MGKLSNETLNSNKKNENAAQQFKNLHKRREICNVCGKVKKIFEEIQNHNETYPKLKSELNKKKNLTDNKAISRSKSNSYARQRNYRYWKVKRLDHKQKVYVTNKSCQYEEFSKTNTAVGSKNVLVNDPEKSESGLLNIERSNSVVIDEEPMV